MERRTTFPQATSSASAKPATSHVRARLAAAGLALAAALLLLGMPGQARAATYYVAPAGDDLGPGTIGSPWRTIQHGADAAGPGDTVYVRSGAYYEAVYLSAGGASGNLKTLAAYPGDSPVLNGAGSDFAGITVQQGVSWLRLDGFTFVDYTEVGVALDGTNSYIELADLDSSGGTGGLRMTWGYSGEAPLFGPVDHITITGSRFHDNSLGGIDCTPGPCDNITFTDVVAQDNGVGAQTFGADGLAIERGQNITIDRVQSLGNGGDGIDLGSRQGGPAAGILVKQSIAGGNHYNGMKLWAGGRIENSLVYGSGLNPLPLAAFDNVIVELVNNTVAYNMWDPAYAARDYGMSVAWPEFGQPLTGVSLTMINNVFAFNTGPQVGSPTGIWIGEGVSLTERSNLYYSRDDCEIDAAFTARGCYTQAGITGGLWSQETGQGGGDLAADPLIPGPPAGFRQAGGSPLIDAGTAGGAPAVDLEGRTRPAGSGYDIGAYEGSSTAPPALEWSVSEAVWRSYGDFIAQRLTVGYTLANSGPGDALSVVVAAHRPSRGVRLETGLPLSLGTLAAGASRPLELTYAIPPGVTSFVTSSIVTCTDSDGVPLTFPPV